MEGGSEGQKLILYSVTVIVIVFIYRHSCNKTSSCLPVPGTPGTVFTVDGSHNIEPWYQVPPTDLAPGTLIPGIRYQVPGTWYQGTSEPALTS